MKSRFPLLDEPLALDLVNTRIRRDGTEVDLLDSPVALLAWLRAERGRLAWSGAIDVADLATVRALRDAIDRLLRARRGHVRPARADVDRVDHALASGPALAQLGWGATGPVLKPLPAPARRCMLLHTLARDALMLLTGPCADQVRECAHPDCRLQFVARNPRRQWCSDQLCGNRARVAKHYRRHHQAI